MFAAALPTTAQSKNNANDNRRMNKQVMVYYSAVEVNELKF